MKRRTSITTKARIRFARQYEKKRVYIPRYVLPEKKKETVTNVKMYE